MTRIYRKYPEPNHNLLRLRRPDKQVVRATRVQGLVAVPSAVAPPIVRRPSEPDATIRGVGRDPACVTTRLLATELDPVVHEITEGTQSQGFK